MAGVGFLVKSAVFEKSERKVYGKIKNYCLSGIES
jgi:hypothetical protein